jgi:hypothetical protein
MFEVNFRESCSHLGVAFVNCLVSAIEIHVVALGVTTCTAYSQYVYYRESIPVLSEVIAYTSLSKLLGVTVCT